MKRQSILVLVIMSIFNASAQATIEYQIIDLGTLGSNHSAASGINNSGQVVGQSQTASGDYHAFLWSDGVMNDLGTLGGDASIAYGINNAGQVVGQARTVSGSYRACRWSNGVVTDLGSLSDHSSEARAINEAGQVVGWAYAEYSPHLGGWAKHAFVWSNGVMTDIGTLGGPESMAYSINDLGQVVGRSHILGTYWRPFIYENGLMTNLGFGGFHSGAFGINEGGDVVGFWISSVYGGEHAVVYSDGVMTDIGTLGGFQSWAYAVNNYGQVVGDSDTASIERRGYIYSDGVMIQLDTLIPPGSGWDFLVSAKGINDNGWIVGSGHINGEFHAYLLVPEPCTLLLLGLGVVMLCKRREC